MLLRSAFAAILIALPAPPAVAEAPPFEDFTFKRVRAPSGAGPRITVQIAPAPAPAPTPAVPPRAVAPAAPAAPQSDWFWARIDPGRAADAAGPGRLIDASAWVGANAASVRAPSLDTLAGIVRSHGPDILRHSIGTRVSPALALAVISVESAGRPAAVSSAGATGLMQLMPATAARFGVEDATHPAQNVAGGIAYLDWLLGHFDGDPILALAGYNAGEGAVARHGGVPPYAETRDYVPKVLAAWRVAAALCATPPILASDGCAFALPG